MGASGSAFSCGSCGKGFRWRPEIAGKKARCACGATVAVPAADPAATDESPIDFGGDDEAAAIPVATAVGTTPVPVSPPPVTRRAATRVNAAASVEYARRKSDRQRDLDANMSVWGAPAERKVPLIVLCVSTLVYFVAVVIKHETPLAISVYSIEMFIRVGLMLLAAHAVAKFAGTSFGVLGLGIIKLAAVCVVCEAIRELGRMTGLGGALLAWAVALITFYALLINWFEMTFGEALLTAITAWAINWIAAVVLIAVLVSLAR